MTKQMPQMKPQTQQSNGFGTVSRKTNVRGAGGGGGGRLKQVLLAQNLALHSDAAPN